MAFKVDQNVERVVTRMVYGTVFADVALQTAIENTLRKGQEILQQNIMTEVYMREPQDTHYERTYTLYHSAKASKYFATGGQIFLSKSDYKKKYYPRYVDEGTKYMDGRHFWGPTVDELKALVEANMLIAAQQTAMMMSEETAP